MAKKSEIFDSLIKLQDILWEDDDLIEQDSLFEAQEILAKLVLQIGKDVKKLDLLLDKYPYLYQRE